MSGKRAWKSKENLEKCYDIVLQSGAKGISVNDIATKLGKFRTSVYDYLYKLEREGRVVNRHSIWYANTEEPEIKPLVKEVAIKLPLSKRDWQREVLLEHSANVFGRANQSDNIFRISLDKLEETRTIRIIGKNVDDLTMQKIENLIKQANEKSFTVNLKGLFKGFKKSSSNNNKTPPQ